MSKTRKKSFLGGAAILAAAVAIVKIIGAVYKIPWATSSGTRARRILRLPTIFTICF